MAKIRVAVVFGGQSSEHEVSRVSAQSVIENIDRDKFDVEMIGITKEGQWLTYQGPVNKIGSGEWEAVARKALLESASPAAPSTCIEGASSDASSTCIEGPVVSSTRKESASPDQAACPDTLESSMITNNSAKNMISSTTKAPIDVVFPVLHGVNGEDGTIQGLFELAGIPYVGCGVLGSAVGMDKAYTKIIFEKEGLPQGDYLVFNRKQIYNEIDEVVAAVEAKLTYPNFVKPSNAGSSVGVSKARDRQQLVDALRLAAKHDRKVLVEEFINGREIECAVLGNDNPIASVVGEVVPCHDFYDYNAKYQSGDSSRVDIPAKNLSSETVAKIREYAVRAFKCLDCSGLSRVDFFVHKETGEIFINEINTLPGFTQISMYPKLWAESGIPYSELITKLIELAYERFEDNKREFDQ